MRSSVQSSWPRQALVSAPQRQKTRPTCRPHRRLEFIRIPWHLIVLFPASQINRAQRRAIEHLHVESQALRSGMSGEKSRAEIGSAACFTTTIARHRNDPTVCSRSNRQTASDPRSERSEQESSRTNIQNYDRNWAPDLCSTHSLKRS